MGPAVSARAWLGACVALAAFVAAVLAWGLWRERAGESDAAAPAADSTTSGLRAVTLWFASAEGEGLVAEAREMVERESLHDRVAALVAALAQGPDRDGVATLPAGTVALHVYLDGEGLLTLDLSREFRTGFRGGSRAEDLAVGALVRTLASNVSGVRRVRLACAGAPLVTLGGHLPLDQPLDPQEWPQESP